MGMFLCVDGMLGASKKMIARDVTMEEIVNRHVIPLMHDVKKQMLETISKSPEDKFSNMSSVLSYIAWSEELVDDDEAALEARKEREVWEERKRRIEKDKKRRRVRGGKQTTVEEDNGYIVM